MRDKYILYSGNKLFFGVRFDKKQKLLSVGGVTKSIGNMKHFMEDFIQKSSYYVVKTAKNKVRYEMPCIKSRFDAAINMVEEERAFSIRRVRSFGRLMR